MKIENARIQGGELILTCSMQEARQFAYRFKPGEYEISPAKKRRSLDANRLLWEICGRIAEAAHVSKEEVYRKNVKEAGVYVPLSLSRAALDDFTQTWSSNGVAWFVEVVDYGDADDTVLVHAYKGSSTYDAGQMSRLIDSIIQDAKSIGLDVLSERERSLFSEYGCIC